MAIGYVKDSFSEEVETIIDSASYLLNYDNGRGLDPEGGQHHVYVNGATGAGKTRSAILPMLESLIRNGLGGIIIDVKNNLTPAVRTLAKSLGREDDVIELGTYSTATKFNLMAEMSALEIHDFLDELTVRDFNGQSNNMDFHSRGIGMGQDLAQLLRYCMKIEPELEPTLHSFIHLFSNYVDVQNLYKWYLDKVYDESDPDQRALVAKVSADDFHIFNDENFTREGKANSDYNKGETRRQRAYMTNALRKALSVASAAPGIMENMCALQEQPLGMRDLHKTGKIVIYRTGPTTGKIGPAIGRMLLNRYYEAVFQQGLALPDGQKRFICIDEFQDVADLSAGRFSDSNFVAKAREFNCMFIVATQSCSSLYANNINSGSVASFLGNCLTKIFFYNDDATTRELAASHNPNMELITLKPGNVFVTTYDAKSRDHLNFVTSLDHEYKRIAAMLENCGKEAELPPPAAVFPHIHDITVRLAQDLPEKQPKGRNLLQVKNNDSRSLRKPDRWEEQGMKNDGVKKNVAKTGSERYIDDPWNFHGIYPRLFSADEDLRLNVPAGWLPVVKNALANFAKCCQTASITAFDIRNSCYLKPRFSNDGNDSNFGSILEVMLEETRNYCPICGDLLPISSSRRNDYDQPRLCAKCLGISPA